MVTPSPTGVSVEKISGGGSGARTEWLNPPAGEYTRAEYLEMVAHYRKSASLDRNKFQVPVDPMGLKFLGNKRVTMLEDRVRLDEP